MKTNYEEPWRLDQLRPNSMLAQVELLREQLKELVDAVEYTPNKNLCQVLSKSKQLLGP